MHRRQYSEMPTDAHLVFVPTLIEEFPRWLDYFAQHGPFNRPDQLACHRRTIERRAAHATVASAVLDQDFVVSLYDTLKAWGLGQRRSRLRPLPEFSAALVRVLPRLQTLGGLRIDAPELDVDSAIQSIWTAVESLSVADNQAQLDAGTKTLHHVLPELVPPMDRAYTQQFFRWHNPQFQYGQEKCFRTAYAALVHVARSTSPRQYVGTHPWHTSVTKVLDNALVGLVKAAQRGVITT